MLRDAAVKLAVRRGQNPGQSGVVVIEPVSWRGARKLVGRDGIEPLVLTPDNGRGDPTSAVIRIEQESKDLGMQLGAKWTDRLCLMKGSALGPGITPPLR